MRWLWASLALGALAAGAAVASPHETFIDVETEQDLYDAIAARLIGSETFERLRELLARGVSLDTASREELYQLPNLSYAEVDAMLLARQRLGGLGAGSALVAEGILSQRQLDAIAPFLRGPDGQLGGGSGGSAWLQLATRYRHGDREPPSLALRLRAASGQELTAGLALAFTRQRLGDVTYDPNRGALLAEAPRERLELAKAFVRWQRGSFAVVVGSYQVGFAQRVTFDDTGTAAPAGAIGDDVVAPQGGAVRACREVAAEAPSPCADEARERSPDVRWREGLWGLAATRRRELGADRQLALHAWASWAPRSLPAAELGSTRRCADLSRDELAECAPLPVLRRPSGPLLTATTRWSSPRLPAVVAERLAGARVAMAHARRWELGVTGYAAQLHGLVGGAALAPQEGSRWPAARTFGAAGTDLSLALESVALGVEVARSFELGARSAPGSAAGGLAAVTRAVWSSPRRELEVGARYYGASFVNPYARSLAAADELEGLRARDEAGMRARYALLSPRGSLRLGVESWSRSTSYVPKLSAQLRGEWLARSLGLGLSLAYDDKDLRRGGARQCFDGSRGADERGRAVECRGARVGAAGRLSWLGPGRELVTAASYDVVDDGDGERAARRHAVTAWLVARARRDSGLVLRAHLRWRDEQLGRAGASTGQVAAEVLWPRGRQLVRARLDGSVQLGAPARATSSLWLTYQVGWR